MWTGQMVTDPTEMEARFSAEDSFAFFNTLREEPTEESIALLDRVRGVMHLLPLREYDFVEMYFFRHMRQTDIAYIFGVSQPTICYRLQRASLRLRYLLSLPPLEPGEVERVMQSYLKDPLDIRIMVLMYETTCQSEVANILNRNKSYWGRTISQGLVRHRFIRTLSKMEADPNMLKYTKLFREVSKHLNILREVQRPDSDDRITHILH